MRNAKGFSIVELFIVVAIIGIIAAIAIPNLLSARRAANEGSAVSTLRTLYGSNLTFASTTGTGNYAGTPAAPGVSSLSDLFAGGLIDAALASGAKCGYKFAGDWAQATATAQATFYFTANPSNLAGVLLSGNRRFGVATDGVLKVDATLTSLGLAFDAPTLAAALPFAPGT